MPSQLDLKSIQELRQAFHNAVRGTKDITADSHAGSIYDHAAGMGAILWSWEQASDKDKFEAIYFDRATGQELTDYIAEHDGVDRILDSYGQGYIYLSRPTAAAGAGTFWKGTRITVYRYHTSVIYEVSKDTPALSSEKSIKVPIRATFFGRDSALDFTPATANDVRITDPLWDNTWVITYVKCGEGTTFETAEEFKARVKELRKLRRVGYADIILNKCKEVGAANVYLLQSDFGGDALDHGINVAYISDAGYNTTDELRFKTILALEDVRVLGADLFVLPIQKQSLSFNLNLTTWTDPRNLNTLSIRDTVVSYIKDYFASTSGFSYDLTGIAGIIRKSIPDIVKSVQFITPSSNQGILQNGAAPTILTKYEVLDRNIYVSLSGSS